jgi:hypothetical protein
MNMVFDVSKQADKEPVKKKDKKSRLLMVTIRKLR